MRNLVPFAVVGSNTIIEVVQFQNQSDGNDCHGKVEMKTLGCKWKKSEGKELSLGHGQH